MKYHTYKFWMIIKTDSRVALMPIEHSKKGVVAVKAYLRKSDAVKAYKEWAGKFAKEWSTIIKIVPFEDVY